MTVLRALPLLTAIDFFSSSLVPSNMLAYYGIDHSGNGWLGARTDGTGGVYNDSSAGSFQTNQTNNMLLNELQFAAAKSVRTSTIILATFNTIAAFGMAMGILWDCYGRRRRNRRMYGTSQAISPFVPSGEVYPLVLSLGITIQGTIFAVAQSTGLTGFGTLGCTTISQLMLPALFLVPYIQFVFALELTLRGLRKKPFQPRGRWAIPICLAVVGLFTLTNYLVTDFIRTQNFCFASLFWFVARYGLLCFVLLAAICSSILACTVAVVIRLYTHINIEITERVCASRMVYYMTLAFVSNCFMIPFFFALAFRHRIKSHNEPQISQLSMVASVAANLSGLMTGGLYLFIKSNTLSTIRPRFKEGGHARQGIRPAIRRFNSHDSGSGPSFDGHILQPVSEPGTLRRVERDSSLTDKDKPTGAGNRQYPKTLRSNPSVRIPPSMQPAQTLSSAASHVRKRSYSLFPSGTSRWKPPAATFLPSTTYTATTYGSAEAESDVESTTEHLRPPPSTWSLAQARHKRDSSMISSATVQIGLRLSNVNDISPMPSAHEPAVNASVVSLGCPKEKEKSQSGQRPSPIVAPKTTLVHALTSATTVAETSPKRNAAKEVKVRIPKPVAITGEPMTQLLEDDDYLSSYADDEPDIPAAADGHDAAEDSDQAVTLSPTVYSAPSPTKREVVTPKMATLPSSSFNAKNSRSPRNLSPRAATGKIPPPTGDWI